MPFSSLSDPVDLARAHAAFEAAWNEIRWSAAPWVEERERTPLAYIVAALVAVAADEDDLAKRAVERYRRPVRAQGRG